MHIKTLENNNARNAMGLLFDITSTWLQQTEPSREELAEALEKYEVIAKLV